MKVRIPKQWCKREINRFVKQVFLKGTPTKVEISAHVDGRYLGVELTAEGLRDRSPMQPNPFSGLVG